MKSNRYIHLLAACVGLVAATANVYAQTAYSQSFDNSGSGTNVNASTVNWLGYANTGGSGVVQTTDTSSTDANTPVILLSGTTGRDGTVSPTMGLAAFNLAQVAGVAGDQRSLAYTLASNFNSGYTAATFGTFSSASWYEGNSTTSARIAFAVQLGTQWYVSDTNHGTASMNAGSFTTQAELKTTTFSSSTWTALNFTPNSTAFTFGTTAGVDLSISAAALANQTVSAIGLYGTDSAGGRLRFDTVVLSAIPEPSTYAALAGAAVLGFVACRRRRSA